MRKKDKNQQKPGWGRKGKKIKKNLKPNEPKTAFKEKQHTRSLFTANTNAQSTP